MSAIKDRRVLVISGLFSVLPLGCLCPPCAGGAAQTGGAAAPAPATGSEPAPVGAATTADPGDLSKPVIIWNGDDVNPAAKQWASCDTQPCTATLEPAPKVGSNGSIGLEFKAKGKGFLGFGWNWTSWYAGGATNVAGRKNLKFSLKIVSASPELAPAVDGLRVGLRCAKSDKCGKEVGSLAKYEPKAADGEWHQITIPLGDMKTEQGNIWDDASVWEMGVFNWAPTPREFVAYLDDITFE